MGEYSREQRNQLSRVIANNTSGSRQLKGFADNRCNCICQQKIHFPINNQFVIQCGKIKCTILAQQKPKEPEYKLPSPYSFDSVEDGRYNFVVIDNVIFMDKRKGHPELSGGEKVDYAGEIQIENKNVKWWSNGSGHYTPNEGLRSQALLDMNKFYTWQDINAGKHLHQLDATNQAPFVLPQGIPVVAPSEVKKKKSECLLL